MESQMNPCLSPHFWQIYEKTLKNAGYFCGASIHGIRRQLGKKVDEKYTAVRRSQHLTQADPRVFGQNYVANCSSVDGQAAFLGESSDHRHIDYFQSLEKFREQGLPCELLAHLEEAVSRDPRLCELQSEVQALTLKEGQGAALTEARRRLASHRKTLNEAALRQHQQEWVQSVEIRKSLLEKRSSRATSAKPISPEIYVFSFLNEDAFPKGWLPTSLYLRMRCGTQCKTSMHYVPAIFLSSTFRDSNPSMAPTL